MSSPSPEPPPSAAPLAGVLVADLSRVLAGPLCTMLLADLGADVVKIERPEGDDTRQWGPPWTPAGTSAYFESVNRGKRSVVLDLREDGDRAAARALAERADVLVENFRPGTLERFGLGHDELVAVNPGLVLCSLTGFGRGAGADLPGYDLLVQAMGGLMSITGAPDGPPTKVGVALVDVLAGLFATVGILAALRAREGTGHGQRVDVTLLGAVLAGLVNQAGSHLAAGAVPRRLGNAHPSIVPYEPLPAADGELVVAVGNDRQFAALCDVLGVGALASDPRFATNGARVAYREELVALLSARLATRERAEWTAALTERGVPCGPINDVAGAFALAASLGLDPVRVLRDADGIEHPQTANPIGLSAHDATARRPPPRLGEHTDEVRRWLGA